MGEEQENPRIEARMGFFPLVTGEHVAVTQAGAMITASKGDFHLTQGGATAAAVGGDLKIRQGGAQFVVARGDVSISQGGAAVVLAPSIAAERSYIGFAIARDIELSKDSKILFGLQEAAVFGAALGLVAAGILRLLRR